MQEKDAHASANYQSGNSKGGELWTTNGMDANSTL